LSEELFASLGMTRSLPGEGADASCLSIAAWASWDEAYCVDNVVTVPIQVNGKVKARMDVERDASEETVRALALENPIIQGLLASAQLKKFIYVPGRICNLIVQ